MVDKTRTTEPGAPLKSTPAALPPADQDRRRDGRLTDLDHPRTDDDTKGPVTDNFAVCVADLAAGARLAVLAGDGDGLIGVADGWERAEGEESAREREKGWRELREGMDAKR
jgi:hypothetical protein